MSTEKKTKKTRKPKTKRLYFGPEVDLSIIKYNASQNMHDRSLIYQKEIKPAFEKLVENIIHTFKFYYTGDQTLQQVQHEVVSFLVERLPNFKKDNGKAFSYFSIVAKNYCILKNRDNYKKLTSHNRIDSSSEVELEHIPDTSTSEHSLYDFTEKYIMYWDANLEKIFTKKNDRVLAGAIVELFRKRDGLELYKKKALYFYVKEIAKDIDPSTQQVTKMMKIMKDKFKAMYNDYLIYNKVSNSKLY